MPQAWRIVQAKQAPTAFSGEGAAKYGGRWNSQGRAVVYASATISLAALETLVHLVPPVLLRYVVFRIDFDDALVEKVEAGSLSRGWKAEPPAKPSQAIGDSWVRQGRTAVLEVPSIIVPSESNYLLNPSHPDFKKISIGKPKAFAFDPRLLP